MKKKFIALVLSLVLCLSAGLLPAVNAYASTPAESLTATAKKLVEMIEEPNVAAFTAAAANNIAAIKIGSPTALVNSKKTQIDPKNSKVTPIKKGGRTLLPLRFCAAAMGGKTKYISDKDYITVTLGDKTAKFKINSKTLQIVNSKGKVIKKVTMDVAATKVNGRVQVPLRAISEGLGCKVYYEKIGADELVLVSQNKLYSDEKSYYMAELQNLSKYTFTNKEKTYKVTLPGAWSKEEESKGAAVFGNPLYPMALYSFEKVSASEAKEMIKISKADLKEIFEGVFDEIVGEEGVTTTVTDYKKYTVGGKNALRFSLKMVVVEEGETINMYLDFFFVASNKTGLAATCVSSENDKSRTQFKTACNTVKLLK